VFHWLESRTGIEVPKFTKLNPSDVQVGRGRSAAEARVPYVEALKAGAAGRIDLERGDKPATVKRLLEDAAKQSGTRVRSSWETKDQKALLWKKVGS